MRSSSLPCCISARATSSPSAPGPALDFPNRLGLHLRAVLRQHRPVECSSSPTSAVSRRSRRRCRRSGHASSTMQPRSSNVFRCDSKTRRTRRSSGNPPRSRHQATRTPLKERSSGPANSRAAMRRTSDRAHRRRPTTQQERHVGHRPRHRSLHRDANERDLHRRVGHQANARPQRDDVVEVRRIPQRAAKVAAVGERQHARRQRGGRASGRSARALGAIVRIPRGAVDRVVGVRTHAELGHVRLPDREWHRRAECARRAPCLRVPTTSW